MDLSTSIESLKSFLRSSGPDALTEKYAVRVKRHKVHDNLVQLHYDQLNSPFGDEIVQLCRGIILDSNKDWEVVALPYTKFFNYGEGFAEKLDWSTAKVYEKLDGSTATLYWYESSWHVASSNVPDGSGRLVGHQNEFDQSRPSLASEFWNIWKRSNYDMPKYTNMCYMFELLTKWNQLIARPGREFIALHGVRDLTTLNELDPHTIAKEHNWEAVNIFNLNSVDEIIDSCKNIDPTKMEGYVVCDSQFRRYKIKSPQYVSLSLISKKDPQKLNFRRMLEVVIANEGSEFLAYFPHLVELHTEVKYLYDKLCEKYQVAYDSIAEVPVGKEFNAAAQKSVKNTAVLFTMKKTNVRRAREALAKYYEPSKIEQMIVAEVKNK